MASPNLDTHPYRGEIRLLLTTALSLFVFTVVVGILNGTDIVDFGHETLLTHVHVGTLGWITMTVFAATIWLFAGGTPDGWRGAWPRIGAPLAAASITLYSLAFLTTTGWSRPGMGTITALVILGFFAWAVVQGRDIGMSVVRWGFLVGLATSVTGGILGVLYGVLLASEGDVKALPSGGEDAHPATMVVGFLVPVGMALAEWWLRPDDVDQPTSRSGFVQMMLLFVGGVTLMIGILLDIVPLITLNLPFEIVAVIIFLRRNWQALGNVGWEPGRAPPFLTAASIYLVFDLGMLVYLISKYADDFDAAPERLLLALDHVLFIGVMTNAVFGMIRAASADRRSFAAWADPVIFWCMNLGLAAFWTGLVLDTAWPKRLGTPFMGGGILLAIAVFLMRLHGARFEREAPRVEARST